MKSLVTLLKVRERLCAFMTLTLTILCTISGSSMRLRRLVIYPKVTSMKS